MLGQESVFFRETNAGDFTRIDGTVQFYTRVNALLRSDMDIVDYGAGRGAAVEDPVPYRRKLQTLKGKVTRVIGIDIDPVVKTNPLVDEPLVVDAEANLPLPNESIDLIVSDWVFEHVKNPAHVANELTRILKPGGWICARTPNKYGYVGVGNTLIPNNWHKQILRCVQPRRRESDVFPTHYRLNTFKKLKMYFPLSKFDHFSYTWNAEPAYFGGSKMMWGLMLLATRFLPEKFGATLLVFLRKKAL